MFTKIIGNFIEEYPKISLGILVLGIAGAGSAAGFLLGPAGFFVGAAVTSVAAARQTTATTKMCPEFWQDPTNNCEELDFRKTPRLIKHFPGGGGVVISTLPLEKWACEEFETSAKETTAIANRMGKKPSSAVNCRSVGELKCVCERFYKESPKLKYASI